MNDLVTCIIRLPNNTVLGENHFTRSGSASFAIRSIKILAFPVTLHRSVVGGSINICNIMDGKEGW